MSMFRVIQRGLNGERALDDPVIRALKSLDSESRGVLERYIASGHRMREALQWAVALLPCFLNLDSDADVIALLVDEARKLTDADNVWALTFSGDLRKKTASFEAFAGSDTSAIPSPSEISNTVVGRVMETSSALWSSDIALDNRLQKAESVLPLRSVGCIPIGVQGVLYLADSQRRDHFSIYQQARLESLCQIAAVFLAQPRQQASQPTEHSLPGMVGHSPAMLAVAQTVRAFAPMPWPALILGETGTGKELVARAMHSLSPRSTAPFVAVNCGAIPEDLAESILFGHEKGAFTSADRKKIGMVEEVGEGTLFLDEVAELTPRLQIKLLRLLQEGSFRRVGGDRDHTFSGRIIAATWRKLDEPGDRTSFREDLYYRVAACIIKVPPLRDRAGDIPELATKLVEQALSGVPGEMQLQLTASVTRQLTSRPWHGNVRELENVLRSAIARCIAEGSARIESDHLLDNPETPASRALPAEGVDLATATEQFQQTVVYRALEDCGGNRTKAAERIGVSRQWLHNLLNRWKEKSEPATQ